MTFKCIKVLKFTNLHNASPKFISEIATSGVSGRVKAVAVGHSSISSTQRYLNVNKELVGNAVELA